MKVSCQCGHVEFETPTPEPIDIYHCHCLECRAQSASAFGTSAIYPAKGILPLDPALRDRLAVWTRKTDAGNTLECYFCPNCGVRVLHVRKDPPNPSTVSIKGGLVKGLQWKDAKHIFCKSAVINIPESAEMWDGEPDDIVSHDSTMSKTSEASE